METNDNRVIYRNLSYHIIQCAMEVHNILGPGYPERIYEEALVREFGKGGISFERQKQIELSYKGEKIGDFWLDLVVEEKIVVELKAVSELSDVFEAQVLSYLKATGLKLGLIINFGGKRLEYKRLIN